MDDELYEEIEVETYDENDLTVGDYAFIGFVCIACCAVVAFLCWQIRKTFKNVHLKIGNKVDVGIETKDK